MEKIKWWKSTISSVLIVALISCFPLESVAQSAANRSKLLENGTQLVLRINETFKANNTADTGTISSIVETDVYSADGAQVLIKAGTPAGILNGVQTLRQIIKEKNGKYMIQKAPAFIEFTADPNGSWGKAGKICLTHATTKTIDNKRVSLRLSSCKNGSSKLGGVIILSVLFFPIGLISGCMKGSMPKIQQGTTLNASTMQDVMVE